MGWLSRQGFGLVCVLSCAGVARATPNDEGTAETPKGRYTEPRLAMRGGAEWGVLSAPIPLDGEYRRPDGTANATFYEPGTSRELIAGRLEAGAATQLSHGLGLVARGGVVFGSSPLETRSTTVAGVQMEYGSQQMFFALAGGMEFQFLERALGVGLDLGWAGTWDPGRPTTPVGLELTRYFTSGPYVRFSAMARLPWRTPIGLGLYAAFDTYLTYGGGVDFRAQTRTSVGAFFELDGSR